MNRWKHILAAAYGIAVLLSWLVQRANHTGHAPPTPAGMRSVRIAEQVARVPVELTVAYREWSADAAGASAPDDPPVIVLLHGAPGDSSNFGRLAPRLAARGARVVAFDQPGFGASSLCGPGGRRIDLSIRANARRLLLALDAIGVSRAHVVGWSNGGGTAMWMADSEPDRVASLTLIGSIGVQELEGSGSHWVEHRKYEYGRFLLGLLPDLTPHFGLLGSRDARIGWLRNFSDSDQRELPAIMGRIGARSDTLILHGAYDVLAPLRVAERTHELIGSSRLLVLDANHFLPFRQGDETADAIAAMVRAVDGPAELPASGSRLDRWRQLERPSVRGAADAMRERLREVPWWVHAALLAIFAAWSPTAALALACVAVVGVQGPAIDPFVGLIGLVAGALARSGWHAARGGASGIDWSRRINTSPLVDGWRGGVILGWRGDAARGLGSAPKASRSVRGAACVIAFATGVLAWATIAMALGILGVAMVEHALLPRVPGADGAIGWLVLALGVLLVARLAVRASSLLSLRGWRWLRIAWERLTHREYWPAWAWYAMIAPNLAAHALRTRGVTWWLAANPGIEAGGGWIGESKWDILRALGDHPRIARAGLVRAGKSPAERTHDLERVMHDRALAFPIILKPDIGERGFAVKLARSMDDARTYFERVSGDVIAQAFAPGPCECGILWVRRLADDPPSSAPKDTVGDIFSITAKEFPVLQGDGQRTLESLIERHPRFRRQHRTFLERWSNDASRILARGEVLRLSMAGNHCQGTLFYDGGHLITPELTRAIDQIARAFGESIGRPDSLDFARFDVRHESDDTLRRGERFTIVEMNGTSAESTNIYDPKRSLRWARRVLLNQWITLTELGRWRVSRGAKRWTLPDLLAIHREAKRARTRRGGSPVSD